MQVTPNERGLPTNVDAERFVLGSVLLDDSHYVPAAGVLTGDDFCLESHRRIWRRMGDIQKRGERIDRITIANELMRFNELESVGNLSYLVSLDDGLPQIPNLDSYVRIVKEKSLLRQIIFAAQHVVNRALLADEPVDAVLEAFRDAVTKLCDAGAASTAQPISTAEMVEQIGIDELLSARRHGEVRLPWSRLDAALSGLAAGQIIVVLGETSRGKTSLALQAATSVTAQGRAVLVWTMEMSPRSLFRRMVNQLSGVPIGNRPSGQSSFDERERHRLAIAHLYDHPVFFDRHSRSVASFCASIRRVATKGKIGLAVVDYLQLIRSASRENRAQQVSENSRNLKLAAMDFGIPILVLSQVDRSSVKGKDSKIGLHSAKESGDVENDADVQLAIQAPALSRDQETVCEIEIQKQREGPCGFSIPMVFRPISQTFMETSDERET